MNDIINVLQADADRGHVRRDTALEFLLVRNLMMGAAPRVEEECLSVTDISDMPARFQIINDGGNLIDISRNAEREDATEAVRHSRRESMVPMRR